MERLEHAEVDKAIAGLDWRREGDELVKVARRADFVGALAFVNAVGALAESANHHPDIDIRYNTLTFRLSTHSEGGLTAKDPDLAGKISAAVDAHS
jgi:4a-hydroxytetrahydrobiopterin dehydratase